MRTLSLTTMRRHAAAQGYRIWKPQRLRHLRGIRPVHLDLRRHEHSRTRSVRVEEVAAFLKRPVQIGQAP